VNIERKNQELEDKEKYLNKQEMQLDIKKTECLTNQRRATMREEEYKNQIKELSKRTEEYLMEKKSMTRLLRRCVCIKEI
jgi:hypothetical protein